MDIQFKYPLIKIEQFATFDNQELNATPNITINGGLQLGSNYNEKSLAFTVSVNIVANERLVLTLKVSSYFEISPDSWNDLKSDGFVVIPKEFLYHLGGLSISTTRGILFAKTEGTDLNRLILPLFYMDQLIHSDMKIPVPIITE